MLFVPLTSTYDNIMPLIPYKLVSDYGITSSEQCFMYIMASTSYNSMRWYELCARPTCIYGASSLKQSTGRYVVQFEHNIMIPSKLVVAASSPKQSTGRYVVRLGHIIMILSKLVFDITV